MAHRTKSKHTIWLTKGSFDKLGTFFGERKRSRMIRVMIDRVVAKIEGGQSQVDELLDKMEIKEKDLEL